MHTNYRLHRQRGITNIQIAMGIAVIGLSILGGLFLLKYPESQKVKNEMAELMDLRSSSVNYATKHGGLYTGMSIATACSFGFFPEGRCTGAGATAAVTNQWGGTIAVALVALTSTNSGVAWTFPGLSSRACIDEITDLWHTAALITVGTTAVKTAATQPLNDAATVTACEAQNNNASVVWTFGPR